MQCSLPFQQFKSLPSIVMVVKSSFGLCLWWGFCAVFERCHSLGIPMELSNLSASYFYREFSADMSIRLCQLVSKGCSWFAGNKGHCTHLHLSWRALKRDCERRSCFPLSLGVKAACVMPMLSALTGSVLHTACLCASNKLYDRLQIILICSATLLVAEKEAPTICAVLS